MGNLIKLDNLLKKNRGTKEEKDKNIIDEKHDRDRIFQRSKGTSPLLGGGGEIEEISEQTKQLYRLYEEKG